MATFAPEYNPEVQCGKFKANERVDYLVKDKKMDRDAAEKQVMDENKDVFPRLFWDPDLLCGDATAQERAQWLVDNKNLHMDEAKRKVRMEYEPLFQEIEGERHPHRIYVVRGADGRKLRILVCPKNAAEVSLAAVHYDFVEPTKGCKHNTDLGEKDKVPGSDFYQYTSSCIYPSERPTVYYYLCCMVPHGPLLHEPREANAGNVKRSEWTEPKEWEHYGQKNCYRGYGGQNVDEQADNDKPIHKSVEEAKAYCVEEGYAGFTYEPSAKRMWRLKEISNPEAFVAEAKFDVYQRWPAK